MISTALFTVCVTADMLTQMWNDMVVFLNKYRRKFKGTYLACTY